MFNKSVLIFSILSFFIVSCTSQNSKPESCFNKENFSLSLKYIKWRQNTSKIDKVLVDGYEVEINTSEEIFFKEKGYSLFKVNSQKGIILLPVKQTKKIQTNSQNAFCELVKRANVSSHNYKE